MACRYSCCTLTTSVQVISYVAILYSSNFSINYIYVGARNISLFNQSAKPYSWSNGGKLYGRPSGSYSSVRSWKAYLRLEKERIEKISLNRNIKQTKGRPMQVA